MNEFFHLFVNIFRFPVPDFVLGSLMFLGVFVLVMNLLFRRKAFKL